jgi:hypothetical protein
MTNQLIEILLYSLILSLYINALHIMFQKEMFLRWLYNWLEDKFRMYKIYLKDIEWTEKYRYLSGLGNNMIVYENKPNNVEKYENESTGEITYGYILGKEITKNYILANCYENKWRNSKGLLYIAKPIYACASCMPSIHSLPLLLILPLWKVAIIAVISVTIATLINDKLFTNE